jgi:DnaJ domain
MRDPYHILGISRGASFDDIKTAYRRASKIAHPDLGGSNEAMTELNAAYRFALNELKQGYKSSQNDDSTSSSNYSSESKANNQADAKSNPPEEATRDIDEELEALRNASERYEEQLRTKRQAAWDQGKHITWAIMTCDDFVGFFVRISRSGIKGQALLAVAVVGAGTLLFSFLSIHGDPPLSLSTPSPPPVIASPTEAKSPPQVVVQNPPVAPPVQKPKPSPQIKPPPPALPEERTLIASDGAQLKLASHVIYHLKLRLGQKTEFKAVAGAFKIIDPQNSIGTCVDQFEITVPPSSGTYIIMDRAIVSCMGDAFLEVHSTK